MAIYERLVQANLDTWPQMPGGVHGFVAALREFIRGAVTLQQVTDALALTADDLSELAAIKGTYDALLTANAKADFIVKLHDVMTLCEAGIYAKAKAETELGF